jgi:hypothetical protein
MKSILTFLFLSAVLTLSAQQNSTKKEQSKKYIITESKINEVDNTAFDLDREGFLTFVELEDDDNLYLVNDSQVYEGFTYGKISKIEHSNTEETAEDYQSDTFDFMWNHNNSYDDVTGYASVRLTKIYKPQGIIFTMLIVYANLDLLEYSGYIEGSINFDRLKSSSSKI